MWYIPSHFTSKGDYFFIPSGSSLRKDLNSQTEEKCLYGWRSDWWLNPLISWLDLSRNYITSTFKRALELWHSSWSIFVQFYVVSRSVLVSVKFVCVSPSRFSHFHCNAMGRAQNSAKRAHRGKNCQINKLALSFGFTLLPWKSWIRHWMMLDTGQDTNNSFLFKQKDVTGVRYPGSYWLFRIYLVSQWT